MKGLEPSRDYLPLEPESSASTNSATSAGSANIATFLTILAILKYNFFVMLPFLRLAYILVFRAPLSRVFAQPPAQVLAIEHQRKFERIIFLPGEYIRFQMNDSRAKYEGMIWEVTDSSILIVQGLTLENLDDVSQRVQRDEVLFRFVKSIYLKPNAKGKGWRHFKGVIGGGLLGGGAMYSVLLPLDAWLAGDSPNPTNFRIGLGMLATGALITLLPEKRKYKIGKRYRLRSMGGL